MDQASELAKFPLKYISDEIGAVRVLMGLHSYSTSRRIFGNALTVKTAQGDNLWVFKAMTLLKAGDVLVIDAGGDISRSVVGWHHKMYAELFGCTGFIVHGAIRDSGQLLKSSFPCFAGGTSVLGAAKKGPGEVNVPVSVGQQVVKPKDFIFGDEDGLFCISPEQISSDIFEKIRRRVEFGEKIDQELATRSLKQSWVEDLL